MRICAVAFIALGLAISAGPVFAASTSPMAVCSAQWQAMKKAGTATGSYKDFSKTCLSKSGSATAAPAAAAPAPTAAAPAKKPSLLSAMTAKKPATTAAAAVPAAAPTAAPTTVAKATKTKGAPTAKASDTDPTGATAQCKDGTYSHSKSHSGSCAGHKGVAKFLT